MTAITTISQEPATLPIDALVPHPQNPNRGDVYEIAASIKTVGFYGRVLVQKSSNRIIAGEHRWRAMKERGSTEIPVELLDVDDVTALRIMAADNRLARKGGDDPLKLADLLDELSKTDDKLSGTGYDETFLSDLISQSTGGFTPNLAPGAPAPEGVTQADIGRTQARLDNAQHGPDGATQLELTCPLCAENFFLHRADITARLAGAG